jgi:hypothetical protein
MISSTTKWKSITQRYLGDTWVKNEMAVLATITIQRKMLPISVEQARAQVLRLKEQSLSTEKKGQNTASRLDLLKKHH